MRRPPVAGGDTDAQHTEVELTTSAIDSIVSRAKRKLRVLPELREELAGC